MKAVSIKGASSKGAPFMQSSLIRYSSMEALNNFRLAASGCVFAPSEIAREALIKSFGKREVISFDKEGKVLRWGTASFGLPPERNLSLTRFKRNKSAFP